MRLNGSRVFADALAIDLGTANTLVHAVGRGIVIDEPSVVAVSTRRGTREIWGVGAAARDLVGRTPEPLDLLRPVRDGVIADFSATEEMLRQFIRRARSSLKLRRPHILISVPAGATPAERRLVRDTALDAGASTVHLIVEPVAAALGAGVSVVDAEPTGVVDVGGGTTDVAIIAGSKVLDARSVRCAGTAMDAAIVRYVRRAHQMTISEDSAERIKIEAGSVAAAADGPQTKVHIRGRDTQLGREKVIILEPGAVSEALGPVVRDLTEFLETTLDELPRPLAAQVRARGLLLTGGGALLHGLDAVLRTRLGCSVKIAEDPLRSVIRGSALVLDDLPRWQDLLLTE